MELSWPPDGSKSLQDGFKLSLFWLSTTQAAIATPLLQAPTACRRTFGQDPLFQVPASVSGMGMPVPTSPSRQGCRPFSREFSTTLPPGGGHTETHYRGWVCVTKKGSPPKPPGSAPSGPRRGPAGLGRPQRSTACRTSGPPVGFWIAYSLQEVLRASSAAPCKTVRKGG